MMAMREMSLVLGMTVIGSALWLGCGSPPQSEEQSASQVAESLGTCDPSKSCCVTTFDMTDAFQAQLSAWGCTKPTVLSPNVSTGKYWFWSRCLDTGNRVETYLSAHPSYGNAPYSARATHDMTTLNMNIRDLGCTSKAPSGYVDALWDPTCSTCRPS